LEAVIAVVVRSNEGGANEKDHKSTQMTFLLLVSRDLLPSIFFSATAAQKEAATVPVPLWYNVYDVILKKSPKSHRERAPNKGQSA
jgi:hypothetical protein